jgi:hypothetical protein
MIPKLRIDSQDLKSFVLETYPAVEPDTLEDIVSIDVIIPLDAVQMRSLPITSDPLGSRGQ